MTSDGRIAIDDFQLPSQVKILPKKRFHPAYPKVINLLLRQSVNQKFASSTRRIKFTFVLIARLVLFLYFRKLIHPMAATNNGYSQLPTPKRGKEFLVGYFQTFEWLNDSYTKSKMRELRLKNSNQDLNQFLSKYQGQKRILVHVRLGDYREHENFGLLPESYFSTSLEILDDLYNVENYIIWLFSDEPRSAMDLIPHKWRGRVVTVPDFGGEACATLEAMRHADAYVISNSTLSWWAAQLKHNESAPVIAPTPWFRSDPEPRNLIQKDWIRVKAW
jgi:hypothetical protein